MGSPGATGAKTVVAGPALLAIDSNFAPGPLLIGGLTVNIRNFIIERDHADWPGVKRLFYGVPIGLGAGIVVLSVVSERTLALIIGVSIVIAAAALLKSFCPKHSTTLLIGGAATIALTTLTAALPGPPFALLYSDRPAPEFRGTAGAFLVPLSVAAFVLLVVTGHFGRDELTLIVAMSPGLALGLFSARYARPRLDRTWFRRAVLILSAGGGLSLIAANL